MSAKKVVDAAGGFNELSSFLLGLEMLGKLIDAVEITEEPSDRTETSSESPAVLAMLIIAVESVGMNPIIVEVPGRLVVCEAIRLSSKVLKLLLRLIVVCIVKAPIAKFSEPPVASGSVVNPRL